MGTKLILSKMAGLGMMFGGLKKVDTAKDVAKPIFTSPGGAAAADIAKETIPANKVRSQLEGRGVNKDEMEWTGFNEWIKTKKGEVSKVELEEFFAQNQIEVREVVRGGKGSLTETQMEEIATNEVLSDLRSSYYKDQIVEKIMQKQADEMRGGINDPFVKSSFEESSVSSQGFLKWDDMTRETKEGFARQYRLKTDLPGTSESAFDDAAKQYDDLIENWGSGEITEAEMNQLNKMFDDIGSPNQADRMYQNTLAEIESGEYSLEHLNIEGAGLQVKFGSPSWQLPGGENYRELVLMVPPKKVPWTKENVTEVVGGGLDHDNFYFFKTPDGLEKRPKILRGTEAYPGDTTISQESALQNVLNTQPTKPRYTGGHYPEDDVVAHIRFNERVDPDGNKVLFIEEIQGDWAHKGEQVGFKTQEVKEILKKKELAEARMKEVFQERRDLPWFEDMSDEGKKLYNENTKNLNEWSERQGGMGDARQDVGLTKADKELGEKLLKEQEEIRIKYDPYYDKRQTLNKEYDALEKERAALGAEYVSKGGGGSAPTVERGPFVTDTHQWTNLALKRMIRWGSDNGFDSIGWVTGKQSADRYKVSKTVDSIYWNPDSTRLVAIEKGGNNRVINELVPENKLADYIGKEPANRLLKSPKNKDEIEQLWQDKLISNTEAEFMMDSHSLQGADLDIGGEYHKLIYDQVLTAQAKKIGKKHGAKVEEGSIGTAGPKPEPSRLRYEVRDEEGVIDAFETREAAEEAAEAAWNKGKARSDPDVVDTYMEELDEYNKTGEKIWSMRLTDKLKQASKDGMPYYVALPPLVMGAAAQRTDAQRQQSKSDAQAILAN
jgi:hypothetical protein